MRWLVTGAGGMLGSELSDALRRAGEPVDARDRAGLDVLDADAVAHAVAGADVVVNCAAWTDVDGAEADERAATRLNGDAVEVLARACLSAEARLIHLSTDYVFAGQAQRPYAEDAPPAPLNAYGRSKLVGEQAVLSLLPEVGTVVRTAWLYGGGGARGRNFVDTMRRLADASAGPVDVVDDQHGQPTWSRDLAEALVLLGRQQALGLPAAFGVHHVTASGEATWWQLAREVFAMTGHDPERVRRTTSAAFSRPAARPDYSVLGHDRWVKAGLTPLRPWGQALRDYLTEK